MLGGYESVLLINGRLSCLGINEGSLNSGTKGTQTMYLLVYHIKF